MSDKPKPILRLIAKDFSYSPESWSWFAVIHVIGPLEKNKDVAGAVDDGNDPEHVSEDQIADIYKFLEQYEVCVRPAGNGLPGQRFAHEPWIQWYPNHIIVSQSGGLDI